MSKYLLTRQPLHGTLQTSYKLIYLSKWYLHKIASLFPTKSIFPNSPPPRCGPHGTIVGDFGSSENWVSPTWWSATAARRSPFGPKNPSRKTAFFENVWTTQPSTRDRLMIEKAVFFWWFRSKKSPIGPEPWTDPWAPENLISLAIYFGGPLVIFDGFEGKIHKIWRGV